MFSRLAVSTILLHCCFYQTSAQLFTTTTPQVGSSTTAKPFQCPGNGFFPIPDYCGPSYYNCYNNVVYTETCPGGAIFDPIKFVCTPPEEASCFACPEPNGFFPIPGECGPDYYICINNKSYKETCPEGTLFDPITLLCTVPPVSCSGEFICPSPNGRFPDPDNFCTANYFTCINGQAYLQQCPGSAVFDPVKLICLEPADASC